MKKRAKTKRFPANMKLNDKDIILDHLNSKTIYGYEDQQKLLFGMYGIKNIRIEIELSVLF